MFDGLFVSIISCLSLSVSRDCSSSDSCLSVKSLLHMSVVSAAHGTVYKYFVIVVVVISYIIPFHIVCHILMLMAKSLCNSS